MNKEFIIDRVRKSTRKENQIVAHIYASEKALESYDYEFCIQRELIKIKKKNK